MKRNAFFSRAKDKKGEIYIYEEIGEGWFGGISANSFVDALKNVGSVDVLDIYINSPGGNVFDGIAIYNQLKRFQAKKVVHIDALAASIASVLMLAGDEIRIAKNAQVMIHDPWGMCVGTAEEMRQSANALEQVKDTIVQTYVSRTKQDEEQIKKWMSDETWMTAMVAKERGFVDAIEEEEADIEDMAFNLLKSFKNVPQELRDARVNARNLITKMEMGMTKMRRASPSKT